MKFEPQVRQADLDLETLMVEMGRTRYRSQVESAAERGRRTDARSGRFLLREAVGRLEDGIAALIKKAKGTATTNKHSGRKEPGPILAAYPYLTAFKPGVTAFIAARVVLDSIALDSPLTRTASAIGTALEQEAQYMAIQCASKGSLWADLSRRLQRTKTSRGKRRMVAEIAAQLHAQFEPWARKEKLRMGLLLVELLRAHTGVIEIRKIPRPGRRPTAYIVPTERTLNWLEKSDAASEVLAPFFLPTLTAPRDWSGVWDGGYRANLLLRRPLVKSRDRAAVQAVADGDPTEVFRAVNVVQRTGWKVNRQVHDVARTLWERGHPIAGFQERVDDPCPPMPPQADRKDPLFDPEYLKSYLRVKADWRRRVQENRGRRVLASKTMWLADKYRDAPGFHYPHQVDFRGRMYPVPFFLQPQGDSLARGLLSFKEGKIVRDRTALEYFLSHGAGCFGVDKVAVHERVEWVRREHERLVAIGTAPLDNRGWIDAKKTWEALAWCLEYAAYTKAPAQFVSHLPISMDHTNSGLQMYALLMRDRELAEYTNCTANESPADVYRTVADDVTDLLLRSESPFAAQWLAFFDGRVPREITKRPVMVLPYSATKHACANYVRDVYEEMRIEKGGSPFPAESGVAYKACCYLSDRIWESIGKRIGAAQACMTWLQSVANLLSIQGKAIQWTAPSGFVVWQKYTRWESKRIRTAVGDTIRFARYRQDSDTIAAGKQSSGIGPNFIHSVDASLLSLAVCRARYGHDVRSFQVVHDCYGVLAADAPKMARSLREAAAELFTPDLLARFRDEVQAQVPGIALPPVPEPGDFSSQEVLGALHFAS